eukprot:772409-Rhodomonas_salina.2
MHRSVLDSRVPACALGGAMHHDGPDAGIRGDGFKLDADGSSSLGEADVAVALMPASETLLTSVLISGSVRWGGGV